MPATLNPTRFVKEILRPGIYYKHGKRIVVSPNDVAKRRDSLISLHAAGLRAPVIYEHIPPDPNQIEGVPAPAAELDENELMKLTVGKTCADDSRSCVINANGGLDVVLEIGNPTAAAQLASGAIDFVSPELRHYWEDPRTGNVFPEMVSHIALTHHPIQTDQRPGFAQLSSVPFGRLDGQTLQLSAADLIKGPHVKKTPIKPRKPGQLSAADQQFLRTIAVQLAFGSNDERDDEDSDPRPGADNRSAGNPAGGNDAGAGGGGMPPIANAPPSNPDMPAGADGDAMQLEALLAHAKRRGIVMPADTTLDNLVSRLLTAFMTLNEADAMHEADDAAEATPGGGPGGGGKAQEFSPMNSSQMSGGKAAPAPVDDAAARAALVARIRACKQLPAAMRETLLVNAGAVQFSGGAEKRPAGAMTIGDVLAMYEEQAVQFSGSPQANLVERIRRLKDATAIPPGVADNLLAKVGTVQFAADGKEVATGGVSLSGLVAQYEAAGQSLGALFTDQSKNYQLSAIVTPEHPAGERYTVGKPDLLVAGSKEAIQFANNVLERTGHGSSINADGTAKPVAKQRISINATEASRA